MTAASTRRRRGGEAGFTLLELLVATVAGLSVVLAAFLLSRGTTRLFASEGRVANAQLNLRLGAERLRRDLARAGFMTTANVAADPDVCPNPNGFGGSALKLQAIRYVPGTAGSIDAPISTAQGLAADRIILSGNYTSTDSYLAADIGPATSGAGWDIRLQTTFGASTRLLAATSTGSALANLKAVFPAGRIVRVRNDLGSSQFLEVDSVAIGSGGVPIITTKATPPYTTVEGSTVVKRCGGRGGCIGCEISPVQFIQYAVRSLATDSAYAWAYPTGAALGDKAKYDLVRSELAPDGSEIGGSAEIVAEYAVDLAFAFAVDTSNAMTPGAPYIEPTIESFPFGDARNGAFADDVLATATARPQRIRSVRFRLATRARHAEYDAPALAGSAPTPARYDLDPSAKAAVRYARMRTAVEEVALPNQGGLRW